jgi:HD-like signal output (HDOD) protein
MMIDSATPVRTRQLLKQLPAFSPVAVRLMVMVTDENVSFKEVAKLFSLDPVLAGQVLQVANSGMYGRETNVRSVLHALAILGLRKISRIAITTALSHGLPRRTSPWMRTWWRHSIASAIVADHVAIEAQLGVDFGYTAGLLHAIGQLALYQNAPNDYPKLLDSSAGDLADLMRSEREYFGADHAELTGMILADWGLPQDLQSAVTEYCVPLPSDPLSATVQAGCAYAESLGFGQCGCLQTIGEHSPGQALDKHLLEVLATEVNLIECSLG